MTGEEISGPAGPKLLRLVSFVGAAGNSIPSLSLTHTHFPLLVTCIEFKTNPFSDLHRRNQQVSRIREEHHHQATATASSRDT